MTKIHTLERRPKVAQEEPAPLLLLLHGYGSDEHDLMALSPYLDPRLHIVSARAIYDIGYGYAWYHLYGVPGALRTDDASLASSLAVLTKFTADLPGRLGANPRQVYLMGFSQGAVMSLALALTAPQLVAGVIVASGYLHQPALAAVQPESLAGVQALVVHGTEDDLIPVAAGRQIRDYLRNTPARCTYQEYPIGHGIHPEAVALIQQWLGERMGQGPA